MNKDMLKRVHQALNVNSVNPNAVASSEVAGWVFNGESAPADIKTSVDSFVSDVNASVATAFGTLSMDHEGFELSSSQLKSAQDAMLLYSTLDASKKSSSKLMDSFKDLAAKSSSDTVVNVTPNLDLLSFDTVLKQEAFDGQTLKPVKATTVLISTATSKQDDFADAFFPLINLAPTDAFYEITYRQDSIQKEFLHVGLTEQGVNKTAGASIGINIEEVQEPVLKNLFNNSLLGENKLKLIPYYADAEGQEVTVLAADETLLTDLPSLFVGHEISYQTAPYVMGADIDIRALAQLNSEAAKGVLADYTDALDRSLSVSNLYLSNGTDYAKIGLKYFPRTKFYSSVEGNNKQLTLAFDTNIVLDTANTFKLDVSDVASGGVVKEGTDPLFTIASAGTDPYLVTVRAAISGTADTQTTSVRLSAAKLVVVKVQKVVLDTNGDRTGELIDVSKDDQIFKDARTAVEALEIKGYDLDASLTNSNFRKRNLLLTSLEYKYRYICPIRSGVQVVGPLYDVDGQDNDLFFTNVESQSLTISAMMSIDAVKSVVEFAGRLEELNTSGQLAAYQFDSPVTKAIYPWYNKQTKDVKDLVDSTRSLERREDVAAAIMNKIRDAVIVMGIESNYTPVYEKIYNNKHKTVVIGTDPYIASYLGVQLQPSINASVTSNKISLTQDTDAIVVSSANPLMRGKVIVSYIVDDDPNRNTAYNMLSFGFGLFSAPYVREVQARSMHGGVQKEVHVNPRWQYYPTLPVVAEFEFTGISEAIEKNVFVTKVQP